MSQVTLRIVSASGQSAFADYPSRDEALRVARDWLCQFGDVYLGGVLLADEVGQDGDWETAP